MIYDFKSIEKYWQKYWKIHKTFQVKMVNTKQKYYILDMFPYPSGSGLHVGHPLGYIASDIYARYKRSEGYNVLHPIGFDSFGLPAEQYAIQTGEHPEKTTKTNIQRYKKQLKRLGFSFDWSREIHTNNPNYYKWTQWIFIQLFNSWYDKESDCARPIRELIKIFEKNGNSLNKFNEILGITFSAETWKIFTINEKEKILQNYRLAFRSKTTVNWCPELGTVLANDEIKNGKSERGNYPVYQKEMIQWIIRITAYAERLLQGLTKLNWPKSLKESQNNWIGKSFGVYIFFKTIEGQNINIFTTRPDTIFGSTFIVLAPENFLVLQITKSKYQLNIKSYIKKTKKRRERERISDVENISGEFTGSYVIHPFTNEILPIYISDYILSNYGTGAIIGVPAHNNKDHKFAKKFNLKIKKVISSKYNVDKKSHEDKIGYCINSDFLNGLEVKYAIKKIIEIIEKKKIGKKTVNYRIRNTVFSRQRYWGEPIPIYYKQGIATPLPEKKLPLLLPKINKYLPNKNGNPPLSYSQVWAWNEKEEKIVPNKFIDEKEVFPLETNVMPGWAGSSWYFLRYMDPNNKKEFLSIKKEKYWKNVDLYVGGSEHATGHLLYARFFHKFLKDYKLVNTEEPFERVLNQGMILSNSAFIAKSINSNKFFSSGLINNNNNIQKLYVDINLLKKNNELNIKKFKKWRPEFSDFEMILENKKFFCNREIEKMSKSKYNIINPDNICKKYGADTLRIYEMFLGPIEQSKPWNIQGIIGVHNFLKKFFSLFFQKDKFQLEEYNPSMEELKVLHKTIKKVREDIETFSFNTSISTFMITVNMLLKLKCYKRTILEPLVILISPFAPHIAEFLWEKLGYKNSICFADMPKYNPQYLIEKIIEYPIMFNGKFRFKMKFESHILMNEIKQKILKYYKTKEQINGKILKKVIIIPNKIVNIVTILK